jgi:hypothetical protein
MLAIFHLLATFVANLAECHVVMRPGAHFIVLLTSATPQYFKSSLVASL